MKRFTLLLLTVILTVSLCGVLWADDDHPVRSWVDEHVKDTNLFSGNPEIVSRDKVENKKANVSSTLHPEAKYRVSKWIPEGDKLKLEIVDRNGKKAGVLTGVRKTAKVTLPENGRLVNLKNNMPIQFTVPDWVEVVHLWKDKGYNYEVTEDGLKELPVKGEARMAYPGDTVLVKKGNTMTVWLLQ